MEKYNRLCTNLEKQLAIDCKTTDDVYCDLLRTFYKDCIKFRDRKIRQLTLKDHKDGKQ
jgi:hypothetical protein